VTPIRTAAELYHYNTCGRDDVWLENGAISRETTCGPADSIVDADGLMSRAQR
jgi:hypothetical protein